MKRALFSIVFMLMFVFAFSACAIFGGNGGNNKPEHVCTPGTPQIETLSEATCTSEGQKVIYTYCSECGQTMDTQYESIAKVPHTPGRTEEEYSTYPNCSEEGLYIETVYCDVCYEIASRTEKTAPTNDDHNMGYKEENSTEPSCIREGSYDKVIYCTLCDEEFSRETVTIGKTNHTKATAVMENVVSAGCGNPGTYDLVVYCSNSECKIELSRESKMVDKLPHTPKEAVVENKVDADCTSTGSYESVVYCGVCNAELERKTVTIPITHGNDEYGICVICDPDASRGLQFAEYDTYCSVLGLGKCTDIDIIIPLMYNGKPVEYISESAFSQKPIESVVISKNIYGIVKSAFANCSKLKTVTFKECELNYIDNYAFAECNLLESIEIPGSVMRIGNLAFAGCEMLNSIAFSERESSLSIGENAFNECKKLSGVYVESITDWCRVAFSNQWANPLATAKNLYVGGELAEDIVINGVTQIYAHAFYNCLSLRHVVISMDVTSIGDYAFNGCDGMLSITIPASVTDIGDNAFHVCNRLIEVVNNSGFSITSGYYGHITAMEVHTGESKIANQDGYLFYTYNSVNYLVGYAGDDTELTLPDSYNDEEYLIYKMAFQGLKYIRSVYIPGTVSKVGEYAFNGCESLKSVTICDGVEYIYDGAFYGCGLVGLVIEATDRLNISGDNVFGNCSSLKKLVISTNVYISGNNVFLGCPVEIADIANHHSSHLPKTNLVTLTVNGSGAIYGEAFKGCTSLVSVVIGDKITSIGARAFYECTGLVSVTVGESVTSIGESAFHNCYKLIEVINKSPLDIQFESYENGEIGYYAQDVHNGSSKVVKEGDYLFYTYNDVNYLLAYLGSDMEIELPINYNGEGYEIYYAAFYGRTDLISVSLPLGLTTINAWAFTNCTNLTSVKMGYMVIYIGQYAFSGCKNLESIYYSGTEEQWSAITVDLYNDELASASIYYFSASQPSTANKYWHYDENGEIVIW